MADIIENIVTLPESLSEIPFGISILQDDIKIISFLISIFAGCILGFLCDIVCGITFRRKELRAVIFLVLFVLYIVYLRLFCYIFLDEVYSFYITLANTSGFIIWELTVGIYIKKVIGITIEKIVRLLYGFMLKFVRNAKNDKKTKK